MIPKEAIKMSANQDFSDVFGAFVEERAKTEFLKKEIDELKKRMRDLERRESLMPMTK